MVSLSSSCLYIIRVIDFFCYCLTCLYSLTRSFPLWTRIFFSLYVLSIQFISSSFNTRAFFNSILLLDYCIHSLTSMHFSCTRFFLLLTYLIIICHLTVAPRIAASCILEGFGILQNPIVYLKLFRVLETNVHVLQGEEKRLKCRFNTSLRFQSVIGIA